MLNVNPETVCRLIDLAQEFHAQEEVTFPAEPDISSDDWGTQILAAHDNDLTLQEFRAIIDDLSPEQQSEVVALHWLGRGEYTASQWTTTVRDALASDFGNVANYLIAHPLLPDYLREGLDMLGYSCD